jgi:hypothetical protein
MAALCGQMLASAEAQNWGYHKLLLQLCEVGVAHRRERRRQSSRFWRSGTGGVA